MQSITSLLPTALRRVLPFGAAAVLFSMFSLQAKADLCVTQYSGCTSCSWSGSVWVPGTYPDFNGHYEVQSGFDSYCEYGSATPWVSGGATASSQGNFCGATGPLPNAEQVCYVEAPTQPSGNVQFAYRYYNSGARQHFYTVTQSEKPWGWTYEGVGFKTLVTPIDGNMTQLYRCIVGTHFVTTDPNCEGYTMEGSYGYVSTIERPGYVALHRFWNGRNDHFVTTNKAEGDNAHFYYYGILGYVPQ